MKDAQHRHHTQVSALPVNLFITPGHSREVRHDDTEMGDADFLQTIG